MFTASLGILLFGALLSVAGGWFGAAIGANFAFFLTGFSVLAAWGLYIGSGSTAGFDYLAFGPFMGPHVAFAAGVAAAAYAAKKGYITSARDLPPLAALGKPDVMLVGAGFGLFGYLAQLGISKLPWFGTHTDSVAFIVVTSGIIARLMFGGKLFNTEKFNNAPSFFGKIAPNKTDHWLRWQEKPSQYLPMGFFAGLLAAGASIAIGHWIPGGAAMAHTFTFGISALIVGFLILGADMPIQHHVTIVAGLATMTFMPIIAAQALTGWVNGTPKCGWSLPAQH